MTPITTTNITTLITLITLVLEIAPRDLVPEIALVTGISLNSSW
jgi:hypothetical protein